MIWLLKLGSNQEPADEQGRSAAPLLFQHWLQTKAAQAKDFTNQRMRRGAEIEEEVRSKNRNKSKVRYRGLDRNATRSFVVLGLANIHLARTRLMG